MARLLRLSQATRISDDRSPAVGSAPGGLWSILRAGFVVMKRPPVGAVAPHRLRFILVTFSSPLSVRVPVPPVAHKFRHGLVSVFLGFAPSCIRYWRSKMNLNALADRPAVAPFAQRVSFDFECEMRIFGHNANMMRGGSSVRGKFPPLGLSREKPARHAARAPVPGMSHRRPSWRGSRSSARRRIVDLSRREGGFRAALFARAGQPR